MRRASSGGGSGGSGGRKGPGQARREPDGQAAPPHAPSARPLQLQPLLCLPATLRRSFDSISTLHSMTATLCCCCCHHPSSIMPVIVRPFFSRTMPYAPLGRFIARGRSLSLSCSQPSVLRRWSPRFVVPCGPPQRCQHPPSDADGRCAGRNHYLR